MGCILEHCWWVWSLHPFALQSSLRQLLALNWIYVDTFIKLTILLLYWYKDADSARSRTTLFVIWAIVATPGHNARDNQMMTQYAASTLLSPQQDQIGNIEKMAELGIFGVTTCPMGPPLPCHMSPEADKWRLSGWDWPFQRQITWSDYSIITSKLV